MSRTMSRSRFRALRSRLGLEKAVSKPSARREETAALERWLDSSALATGFAAPLRAEAPQPVARPASDPRREGEDARANGVPKRRNPYLRGSKERKAWEVGWTVEDRRLGGKRAA